MIDVDDVKSLQYNLCSKYTSEDPFWDTPPPVHPICLHPDLPPKWKIFGYRTCYMCTVMREINDNVHCEGTVTDAAFLEATRQVFKYGPLADYTGISQMKNTSMKRCPHCETPLCGAHMEKTFPNAPRTNVHGT